jgi:crotonobetainyl-CoA hydratase
LSNPLHSVLGDPVQVSQADHVLEVVLDRPKANAIDAPTSRRLGDIFQAFRDDSDLRVAIVTGGGEKFFCAGWDLKSASTGDDDFGVGGFAGLQELPKLNKPVIAAVNGIAFGGGFELALSADLILAADTAKFALPEIRAGVLADAATIKLPRRVPYHFAMDLLMTGRWMEPEEAQRMGIVKDVVPAAELMDHARELAKLLANGPPLVFAAIKEVVRETAQMSVQTAFNTCNHRRLPTVATLYTSEDMREGPLAFAEKRDPVWKGK